jgi:metal-responsive CopG/Arc/MetJ family transcriptional regulator
MPHRALVSITITIDPDLLMAINQNVDGKSQSERIRKILKKGYESHAERE